MHHSASLEVERISVFKVGNPLVQQVASLTEARIVASFPNSSIVDILSITSLTDIIILVYIVYSINYVDTVLPANTIDVLIVYCRLSVLTLIYKNDVNLRLKTKQYYIANISCLNLTLGKLFIIAFYVCFIFRAFNWAILLFFNTTTKLDCSIVVVAACISLLLLLANTATGIYYIALKLTLYCMPIELYIALAPFCNLFPIRSSIIITYLHSIGSSKFTIMLFRALGILALSLLRGLDNLFYIESSPKQLRADLFEDVEDEFVYRTISHILSIITVAYIYCQFLDSIGLGGVQVMSSVLYSFSAVSYSF